MSITTRTDAASSPLKPTRGPTSAGHRWRGLTVAGALAVALTLVAACKDDHGETGGKPTGATCPTPQTLTYENFGKAFMQSYCLRCHSSSVTGAARNNAPADHNFDVAVDIGLLADHIDETAGSGPNATNTLMPPGYPLPTTEERQKLSQWLACGAP